MCIFAASRLDMRGVRVVTDVEAGCDGRGRYRTTSDADADGEVVWFWHPLAGAKSAGDDLPATVTRKSWTPGRARRKPLRPLRRGGRCFGCTCSDYARVLLLIAREAAGAAKHSVFPAPSSLRGHSQRLGRNSAAGM